MKIKLLPIVILFTLSMLIAIAGETASAQIQSGWTAPHRLSNENRKASVASLVADPYGIVHVFWGEVLDDDRGLLQYSSYDGNTWTVPLNIRYTAPLQDPKSISPFIDYKMTLHLAWVSTQSGPIVYTKVPVLEAHSAQNWSKDIRIQVPADEIQMVVDDAGTIHIVYKVITNDISLPGVYYISSNDEGLSWNEPILLDPDIPGGFIPRNLTLAINDEGDLHAMWFYATLLGSEGDWIRYTRSKDGGATWSPLTTLAKNSEGGDQLNQLAGPIMAVTGQEVHVVWAAGEPFLFRHHRYSLDGGETWSKVERIFGELSGQAGDSLSVDSEGTVHFIGQIRFPMAIYHSNWRDGEWSDMEMIYSIMVNADSPPVVPQVAAHGTHSAFRAGNEIVVSFSDPPSFELRQLFVTSRVFEGINTQPSLNTPTSIPTPTSEIATSTPTPTLMSTPIAFGNAAGGSSGFLSQLPVNPIAAGAGMVVLIIFIAVSGQFLAKLRP